MPNQSLLSCEAETTVQNVIQDVSSDVEPSIRKAFGAYPFVWQKRLFVLGALGALAWVSMLQAPSLA